MCPQLDNADDPPDPSITLLGAREEIQQPDEVKPIGFARRARRFTSMLDGSTTRLHTPICVNARWIQKPSRPAFKELLLSQTELSVRFMRPGRVHNPVVWLGVGFTLESAATVHVATGLESVSSYSSWRVSMT